MSKSPEKEKREPGAGGIAVRGGTAWLRAGLGGIMGRPGPADREIDATILAEQMNRLRHEVQNHERIRNVRSILVTSASEAEGKTTISVGLAKALARLRDRWCLLVEMDLRQPAVAERLGLEKRSGLAGHLLDGVPLGEVIQPTGIPKLSAICAGRRILEAADVAASSELRELLADAESRYEDRIIVIDTPPLLAAPEALSVSLLVDGIVLVVRAGSTPRHLVRLALRALPREKVLGVVLNGARLERSERQFFRPYPAS